jgi:hypothetical protein
MFCMSSTWNLKDKVILMDGRKGIIRDISESDQEATVGIVGEKVTVIVSFDELTKRSK